MTQTEVPLEISPDRFRRYPTIGVPKIRAYGNDKPQPITRIKVQEVDNSLSVLPPKMEELARKHMGKNLAQMGWTHVVEADSGIEPLKRAPSEAIAHKIQESRRILEIEDNWDGEGSVGYSVETWEKAVSFLRVLEDTLHVALDAPDILPGPDGSIDLHWLTEQYEMLVNIPSEGDVATYYGDNYSSNSIKGSIAISGVDSFVFLWLKYVSR